MYLFKIKGIKGILLIEIYRFKKTTFCLSTFKQNNQPFINNFLILKILVFIVIFRLKTKDINLSRNPTAITIK